MQLADGCISPCYGARKKAIDALRQYEKIVSTSKELMSLLDKNYVYQSVNEAYFRAYNKKREEIIGHTVADLLGDEVFKEKVRDKLDRCLTGETVNYRGWFNFPGLGKRFMEANYYPYREEDNSISGIVINARDITRTYELENQLQQSQKREAIGTLAGGIAHDFNNILSSVIGYSELALDKAEKNTPLYDNIEEVFNAGLRARDLVKQILAFSRKTEQKLHPVQIKLIVKEAVKLLRASLPVTIEIRDNIHSDEAVLADATQIHQIVMNLCTNAAHAMKESGGTLDVSLRAVELEKEFVDRHPGIQPGVYQLLSVSDTGHGIPANVIKKIFDPFFTTKSEDEGTGLGLSVVHGIVKSHGGTLQVYSEPGKGSTFCIYLPIIESKIESVPKSERSLPTGSERILYVDDEKPLVDIAKDMLEHLGYRVTTRTSSIEALELFKAKPEAFDLVITDMTMRNMTGDRLAVEMMKIRPDISVILCSGYGKKILGARASDIGIKKFVLKPVIQSDFARTIRTVLDQSQANQKPEPLFAPEDEPNEVKRDDRQSWNDRLNHFDSGRDRNG